MALTPVPSINLESLPREAVSLIETLASRAQEADRLEQEVRLLREMLRLERLRKYGPKSEKLSDEQLGLLELEPGVHALEVASEAAVGPEQRRVKKREHAGRNALPSHLPREEIVHLPSGGGCACPACGGQLRRLGQDADEVLDLDPVVYKVIRHVRPKFSCRVCETIVQAPAPDKPIARGKASFRVVAHVIVSKFDHHLPLYRQAEMMAAQGIDIDRSTLAGWTGQGAALLDPIVARIKETVLASDKLHTDDTPVPMLVPGKGKTAQARLWTYVIDDRASGASGPALVWYRFTPDRSGIHPQTELKHFTGLLQADGYAGYDKLYAGGREMRLRQEWILGVGGVRVLGSNAERDPLAPATHPDRRQCL